MPDTNYIDAIASMDVQKLNEVIEEFSTYFGKRPDAQFIKSAKYWDEQFEIFFRGFLVGLKVNDMPCKPKKPQPKPKK